MVKQKLMNKTLYILTLPILLLSCSKEKPKEIPTCVPADEYSFIDSAFKRSDELYRLSLQVNTNLDSIPRSIKNNGDIHYGKRGDWTCGFYPGSMWYLYEYTNDQFWKESAQKWTENIESVKDKKTTHDIGFMIYCSFGNGYRLTKDTHYLSVINHASNTLIQRFDPDVGCTKSWNRYKFSEKWQFPVIIDNMMNLEMLFFSSQQTGDSAFYKVADSHAATTMQNHFRDDYSSFHVVDYDSITGEVIQKNTHQGINDTSSWARGQTWGLYGFTYSFRETGDSAYLQQAINIADYIINNPLIPEDNIPLWDYCDPDPNAPRDASAAALTASALLELMDYVDKEKSEEYFNYSVDVLRTLSSNEYLNKPGENHNFILLHCTGNYPKGTEIDKPLSYGDYYYLEALLRLKNKIDR